jgi:hypothetical protein
MIEQTSGKYASRFAVRTGARIQVVLAADVEWIGAAGDYSELHAGGRAHLLRETMSSLEQKLDGQVPSYSSFSYRAHQQHSGAALYRQPRVHGSAFRRLRTSFQPHVR